MKGKIKILSLLLAVTMVSSMFVACKGEEKPVVESGKPASQEAEKPAEVAEISWYIWGEKPNQAAAVETALNEKSVKDVGIKVNFKWQTGNDESLRTTLASGDADVDIAFACGWFADYVGSAQKNFFMDLTEMLPANAPDLYAKLPKTLWDGVKVNGKIFGVPTWKDVAATQYWLARKNILEAADATAVFATAGKTAASLTPTLEKIKAWHDADPKANAYSEGNTAPFTFNRAGVNGHNNGWDELQADLRVGVKIAAGNTKVQSYYTDADYITELKTYKDWADRGLSNGKVAQQVEQEPPAITISTAQGWEGAELYAWGGPTKGYDTLIQKKTGPYLTSGYVQGGVNVIGAGSKKAEAALKYLQYLNTNAEFRNMLTYGVEGTNWKQEGGLVEILTGQDWAPGNFALGAYDILLPTKGCPPNMYKDLTAMANTAEASSLLGFVPTTEKIQNEIASCTSLIAEVFQPLQCGAVKDVDATLTALLAKLEAQGYSKIIAEYQAQVDAFLAAKK